MLQGPVSRPIVVGFILSLACGDNGYCLWFDNCTFDLSSSFNSPVDLPSPTVGYCFVHNTSGTSFRKLSFS